MRRTILEAARAASGCLLFCFFLWTAHIALWAPWVVARYVIAVPEAILGLSAGSPNLDPFVLIDALCLALLAAMVATTFALGETRGRRFALLKALQVGSAAMVSLGLVILVLDPTELWTFMTLTQDQTGFATWFTNGMDLVCSAVVLGLTTLAVRR